MAVFLGIMIFYAATRPNIRRLNVFLGGVGMICVGDGQLHNSPSEGLGVKANVGFLQRPERVVLLIIGALSTWDWNSRFLFVQPNAAGAVGASPSARCGRWCSGCFYIRRRT